MNIKKGVVILVLVGAGYFGYQHFNNKQSSQLEPVYEMPCVVVYGRNTCSFTQKCLKKLKAEGIDVIFENIDTQTAKMEIFPRVDQAGHPRNKIVITIIDVNGHILVGYEYEKVMEYKHLELANYLIAYGTDVSATTSEGWTPLHYTLDNQYPDLAIKLIHMGADVYAKTQIGWTPVLYALKHGYTDVARLLIAQGADINDKIKSG